MIERGEHTPLWLSHHWPHDFDRCVDVRGYKVCRRCAVLYPLGLLSALVLGAVGSWPEAMDPWLVWLLPAPAFGIRLVLGGFADEVLHSKRVVPGRLTESGFAHADTDVASALRWVLQQS